MAIFALALIFGGFMSGTGIEIGGEWTFYTAATAEEAAEQIKVKTDVTYRDAVFSIMAPDYIQRFDADLESALWTSSGVNDTCGLVVFDSHGMMLTSENNSDLIYSKEITLNSGDDAFVIGTRMTRLNSNMTQGINITDGSSKYVALEFRNDTIEAFYTNAAGTDLSAEITTISNSTDWNYMTIYTDGTDCQVTVEGVGVFTLASAVAFNASEIATIDFHQRGYGEGWVDFIYYAGYSEDDLTSIPEPQPLNLTGETAKRATSPDGDDYTSYDNMEQSYDDMGITTSKMGGGEAFYDEWNITPVATSTLESAAELTPEDLAQWTYQTPEDANTKYGGSVEGMTSSSGIKSIAVGFDDAQDAFENELADYAATQLNVDKVYIVDYYVEDMSLNITMGEELTNAMKYEYYYALFSEMGETATGEVEFTDGTTLSGAQLSLILDTCGWGGFFDKIKDAAEKAVDKGVEALSGVKEAAVEKAGEAAQALIGAAAAIPEKTSEIGADLKASVITYGSEIKDQGTKAVSAGAAMVGAAVKAAPKSSAYLTQTLSNFKNSVSEKAEEVKHASASFAGQSVGAVKKVTTGTWSSISGAATAVKTRLTGVADYAKKGVDGILSAAGKIKDMGFSFFSGVKSLLKYTPYILAVGAFVLLFIVAVQKNWFGVGSAIGWHPKR